jgi:hypothetical protein
VQWGDKGFEEGRRQGYQEGLGKVKDYQAGYDDCKYGYDYQSNLFE